VLASLIASRSILLECVDYPHFVVDSYRDNRPISIGLALDSPFPYIGQSLRPRWHPSGLNFAHLVTQVLLSAIRPRADLRSHRIGVKLETLELRQWIRPGKVLQIGNSRLLQKSYKGDFYRIL
jgi:hypothetical protein